MYSEDYPQTALSQSESVTAAFEAVRKGYGWGAFTDLIRPEQYTAHEDHLRLLEQGSLEGGTEILAGCEIRSGKNVYAPEIWSSTVLLIRALLSFYEDTGFKEKVLEIGAGSGAASIVAKKKGFGHTFLLTDIDEEAVRTCDLNIGINGFQDDMRAIESNLFDNVTDKFDAIIFNAPLWHKAKAEPRELSLVDVNGAFMRTFLEQAGDYLTDNGEIYIGYSNLGTPDLPESFANQWSFELILAEYIARTGMIKSVYRGKKI